MNYLRFNNIPLPTTNSSTDQEQEDVLEEGNSFATADALIYLTVPLTTVRILPRKFTRNNKLNHANVNTNINANTNGTAPNSSNNSHSNVGGFMGHHTEPPMKANVLNLSSLAALKEQLVHEELDESMEESICKALLSLVRNIYIHFRTIYRCM